MLGVTESTVIRAEEGLQDIPAPMLLAICDRYQVEINGTIDNIDPFMLLSAMEEWKISRVMRKSWMSDNKRHDRLVREGKLAQWTTVDRAWRIKDKETGERQHP
jgi:hypothetical protein